MREIVEAVLQCDLADAQRAELRIGQIQPALDPLLQQVASEAAAVELEQPAQVANADAGKCRDLRRGKARIAEMGEDVLLDPRQQDRLLGPRLGGLANFFSQQAGKQVERDVGDDRALADRELVGLGDAGPEEIAGDPGQAAGAADPVAEHALWHAEAIAQQLVRHMQHDRRDRLLIFRGIRLAVVEQDHVAGAEHAFGAAFAIHRAPGLVVAKIEARLAGTRDVGSPAIDQLRAGLDSRNLGFREAVGPDAGAESLADTRITVRVHESLRHHLLPERDALAGGNDIGGQNLGHRLRS